MMTTDRTTGSRSGVGRGLIVGMAALLGFTATAVGGQSVAGQDWTMRVGASQNEWTSVAEGNGRFVAVQRGGDVSAVSTDGVNWSTHPAPVLSWSSIAFGNGLFVAVSSRGTGNRVMTSPDGVTWTLRQPALDARWNSIAYGARRFVAVGSNRVMTSPDGVNWTSRTPVAGNTWTSVTYGGGLFVAVSNSPSDTQVMTSSDGITWRARQTPARNNWSAVAYGGGRYVAIGNDCVNPIECVMTSEFGINWTMRGLGLGQYRSMAYGAGLFAALNDSSQPVVRSDNGISWRSVGAPTGAGAGSAWESITYGHGMFVAVGQSGKIMTSGTYTPPPAAPPTTGAATTPGATPPSVGACADTFYQQANRTISWNKKRQAYRVVSRIRVFEDAPAACRTKLSMIYRSSKTKVSLAQKAGSTLGYRKLKGNFNAPVISWPNAKEMRFTTGDTTGQNRKNARLVLVSYLKKAKNMPKLNDIELVIVRRIPRDPRAAQSTANPLYGQKSTFGRTKAWAGVS